MIMIMIMIMKIIKKGNQLAKAVFGEALLEYRLI